MQQIYNARGNGSAADRARLLQSNSSAFADMGTTSWGLDEDDDQPIDVRVSVDDLKTQKLRLLQGKLFNGIVYAFCKYLKLRNTF